MESAHMTGKISALGEDVSQSRSSAAARRHACRSAAQERRAMRAVAARRPRMSSSAAPPGEVA
jgi:hypothetical protein